MNFLLFLLFGTEWGEFAHRPNEKFTFAQIRQEIEVFPSSPPLLIFDS